MVTFMLRNATGNTVPPIDEANEIIPKAVDRLLLNQWATILITGPNTTPHDTYKQPEQSETGIYRTQEVAALTPTPKP
jgi:hypothetical protein